MLAAKKRNKTQLLIFKITHGRPQCLSGSRTQVFGVGQLRKLQEVALGASSQIYLAMYP